MEKRLSFDSVQIKDTGVPIDQSVKLTIPILTYPAKPPFATGEVALPGAEITLDLASTQRSEIGGEFCLDQAFYGHFCPCYLWNTEQMSRPEGTKTRPTKLQELPFCKSAPQHAPSLLRSVLCLQSSVICRPSGTPDMPYYWRAVWVLSIWSIKDLGYVSLETRGLLLNLSFLQLN